MRPLTLILVLLTALQPALVVVVGRSPCGESGCALSPQRAACCGTCPASVTAEVCCCSSEPGDEPTPAPPPNQTQDDVLRVLLASFACVATVEIVGHDDASLFADASAGHGAPTPELTHNERLALRCISRT